MEKRYPPLTGDMLDGLETLAYMGALDYQEATRHLLAEVRRLRAGLETLRRDHLVVEDEPYCSCPQSGQCGGNWAWQDVPCDCGADEHNARIDALLNGEEEK